MSCMHFPGYNTGKSGQRSTYVVNTEITPLYQVVALKRLRIMENSKTVIFKTKSGRHRLREVVVYRRSNYKTLTVWIMMFLIRGFLQEAVRGGWTWRLDYTNGISEHYGS